MTRRVFAYTDSEAFGGAEQALAILLVGLAEWGWRPTLLHSDAPGLEPLLERLASSGIPDIVIPSMPEGARGGARAVGLVRLLRAERPDVFHAHLTWPFACKWALAAACAARVPAVLGTVQLFVDVPVGISRRAQVGILSRRVGAMIAVSEDTRARFHASVGWPLERISVVPNAASVERFAGTPDPAVRASLDDGTGRALVLVPARLEEQKGHRYLLEAARALPHVRFLCVGDGELRESLVADAERLGVSDRVSFLGFRADMEVLVGACDLVALPSLYEGLPLALIEAMAAGKAVVATDVGGTRELVLDGVTGILVPPRDPAMLAAAVETLIADPALAARFGSAARRRAVDHFSAAAMVEGVRSEYERVLAAKRAGPRRS